MTVVRRRTNYVRPRFFMTYVVNPIVRRTGLTPVLTVPGRVTGQPHSTPLGQPFEHGGRRYLVSGRGQTQWVRNLRAAGHGRLRIGGVTEGFHARELSGPERDRIVNAYQKLLGDSVKRYFEEIPDPADHPVFEIEPRG
jgi:deazaflavin-dependent oxidoreductase (nitroreductase family)